MVVEEECRNMDEVKLNEGKCDSLFAERTGSDAGDVSYDEVVIYNAYKAYPKFEIHYEERKCHNNCNIEFQYGDTFAIGRREILPLPVLNYSDPLHIHLNIAESQFLRLRANLENLGINNNYVLKKVESYINPKLKKNFDKKLEEFKEKYGVDDK